jgi:enoyl-CoA hydratase/carnithine racemase
MTDKPFNLSHDAKRSLARITLNRPSSGNRMTSAEVASLGQAIRDAGGRSDVKLVVVGAEGDAFCLGRAAGAGPQPANALAIRSELAEPILSLYANVRATEVPVMAVVQGPAMGFGSAFVGTCDLAVAADSAKFAFTEMAHNLPPTLAMSAVLEKLPYKRLMHMVLTREEIDGNTALAIGLVSQVAPRAKLEETAEATIARLIDRDRSALCLVKEYQIAAWNLDASSAAKLAGNAISVVLSSQSHG